MNNEKDEFVLNDGSYCIRNPSYTPIYEIMHNDLSLHEILENHKRWIETAGKKGIKADLRGANLSKVNLDLDEAIEAEHAEPNEYYCDAIPKDTTLQYADLQDAILSGANLIGMDFKSANLRGADLTSAYLNRTNFHKADLSFADLRFAQLHSTNLSYADLHAANLQYAVLIDTELTHTNLEGCKVFGVSAWNLKASAENQSNLIISRGNESVITVDNLEVAQFIYLLLNNEKIRHVIDTITSKVVLILGRFTPERKAVLDAIRKELRKRDFLPVLFDFEKPASRNLTETIKTLASLARFIIADITDASSIPQELYAIVPHFPSLPVQPLLLASQVEYGMFESFKPYPWVLKTYCYESCEKLLESIEPNVIMPAIAKLKELKGD